MVDELAQQAIDFEHKGREFYTRMSRESGNELAKTLFANLADDEKEHARWIREQFGCSAGDGASPDRAQPAGNAAIEDRMKDVFDRLEPDEKVREMDNVGGLEMAMELEQQAIAMYRQLIDQDPSEHQRKFLTEIIKQERQHLEALRNVHFYLTGTGDWFHEQESARWNWMNV